MICVNTISDLTKLNFNEVYQMNIIEFLTLLTYSYDKIRYENDRIKQMSNKSIII